MNRKEVLNRTCRAIERSTTFEMTYFASCGSAGCIAGHVVAACLEKQEAAKVLMDPRDVANIAQRLLRISESEAAKLFYPSFAVANMDSYPEDSGYIDKYMALEVLDLLEVTGRVNWKKARRKRNRQQKRLAYL